MKIFRCELFEAREIVFRVLALARLMLLEITFCIFFLLLDFHKNRHKEINTTKMSHNLRVNVY